MYRIVGVVDDGPAVQVLTGATTLLANRLRAPVHCEILTGVVGLAPAVHAKRTHAVVVRWAPGFQLVGRGGSSGIAPGLRWWGAGRVPIPAAVWMHDATPGPGVLRELNACGFETLWGASTGPELADSLDELIRTRRAARFLHALGVEAGSPVEHAIRAHLTPRRIWPSPEELGHGLSLGRSTLYRMFQDLGLPPPRELMGWIRAYLAICLAEEGRTLAASARAVGLSRSADLVRMVNRRVPVSGESGLRALGSEGVLRALQLRIKEIRGGGNVSDRSSRDALRHPRTERCARGRWVASEGLLVGGSRLLGRCDTNPGRCDTVRDGTAIAPGGRESVD